MLYSNVSFQIELDHELQEQFYQPKLEDTLLPSLSEVVKKNIWAIELFTFFKELLLRPPTEVELEFLKLGSDMEGPTKACEMVMEELRSFLKVQLRSDDIEGASDQYYRNHTLTFEERVNFQRDLKEFLEELILLTYIRRDKKEVSCTDMMALIPLIKLDRSKRVPSTWKD